MLFAIGLIFVAMCNQSLSISLNKLPFSLELLPQPVYLVGGAVRDALLGRSSEYLDLDFVVPSNAVQIARSLAQYYQAGFVILDAQRQIARVVLPQATIDIAQQEGSSLVTDLNRRDFTVNAIAYNPHTQEIIDPLQGCKDLQQRLLKMVSPANLQDDPLRLLRAYRQAAQLNFTIESATQSAIRSLASDISQVAPERVRVELSYLLSNSQGTSWLLSAWEDGLVGYWFNNATNKSFAQIAAVDTAAETLTAIWLQLGVQLSQYVRNSVKTTWLAIAKLACLVSSEPEMAEIELQHLTYSRAEIRSVTTLLKLLPQLQTSQMSLREQYFFFREAGGVFPAIAVLAVANGTLSAAVAPLLNRYLNPQDPVAHPQALVTGNDLIQALQLKPSPLVGKLLLQIQLAQIEGIVSNSTEAIAFASRLVDIQ